MIDPLPESSSRRRVRAHRLVRPHGWQRASDAPGLAKATAVARRWRSPAGTSFLLALAVAIAATIGLVRVHSRTRVLGLGAEITRLTEEHMRLLEQKRRLSAERAYLRHPDQIGDTARDRLGLVPISPELVQRIRLTERSTDDAR